MFYYNSCSYSCSFPQFSNAWIFSQELDVISRGISKSLNFLAFVPPGCPWDWYLCWRMHSMKHNVDTIFLFSYICCLWIYNIFEIYIYFFIVWATLWSNVTIENRICREELKESLGMNFFSPFQPEREFKVYKSCKCSQIICSRAQ